jgi:hypothetical protein
LNRFEEKFESVDSITKYLLLWKKLSSDYAILLGFGQLFDESHGFFLLI